MEDYLVRAIAKKAGVRGIVCVTTNLANNVAHRHETSPTVTAVLGRALTGGALMGALLKVQHRVALKLEGTGPIEKVIVEANSYGKVRGYPGVPNVDLPLKNGRYDITGATGRAGLLTVVRDLGLPELAESVTPLATGETDTDLNAYFNQSEQIPTVVAIGIDVNEDGETPALSKGKVAVAGGILIQAIPPYDENIIVQMADRILELPPIEELLTSGKTPEEIMALLFAGMEYDLLEKRPIQFHCDCSRERSEKALITLGREEIEALLENEGQAVIDCHFCHERYVFDEIDLELILEEIE